VPDTRPQRGGGRSNGHGGSARVAVVPAKVRAPTATALPRERLETWLASAVLGHRFSLVVAPAGSGKTTLLARFVANVDVPVGWYRAESWDDDERGLLRHIEAALAPALPGLATGWQGVEAAAAALDSWTGGRALLVVDDLHALEGTAAEAALGRLVDYAPPWLSFLAATRVLPGFNLSRLRVSGELLEINGDDLRFRAWEVERLFRDFYGDPVPPGELALLARRTEGWAAGLQLFHLATRGKSADERQRILGVVGSSTRLVREYLARNVLAELPDELRRFLVDTCVLGRLTGDLCDRLLDRHGSGRILDDLARRQIFTVAIDDEGAYRYHEVLRAYLDRMLVEEMGEEEARIRHARAGALLERSGALPEALAAYCRAEDWADVKRLLGDRGEQVAGGPDLRLETLPPALVRHDPWLALASARRARAEGRWAVALEAYARAETAFGPASTGSVCRQERLVLTAWLQPVSIPPAGWSGVLRGGLVREPIGAARGVGTANNSHPDVVRGLLLLAAGEVRDARRVLSDAADGEGLERALVIASKLAAGVAGLLAGDAAGESDVDAAVEAAERANLTWLARAGRIAGRLGGRGTADSDRAAEGFATEKDEWGGALAALAEAWAPGHRESAGHAGEGYDQAEARIASAERAASLFRRLGAGVLEAWARALGSYGQAEGGIPDARESALAAESIARAAGAPGPRLLAYAALARADEARSADYERLVAAAWQDTGLVLPPTSGAPVEVARLDHASHTDEDSGGDPGAAVAPTLRIRTFGAFALEVDGRQVSLQAVRPRARAVLRFLALNVGTAVHREVIQEALWPEADGHRGGRSLHVAISALRGLLVQTVGPDGQRLIVREGDAYRLSVDPLAVDIGRFEEAMSDGRAGRARGGVASGFAVAIQIHRGDLLPQDGPAEWVVERREHYRREAVEAARSVAEEALLAGDLDAVVQVCRAGLELDRYHDPLWRLLIAARDRAGDAGAAGRDRLEYEAVLAGLGVTVETAIGSA
jgi:DNA-binding SARP family transcriptional activator